MARVQWDEYGSTGLPVVPINGAEGHMAPVKYPLNDGNIFRIVSSEYLVQCLAFDEGIIVAANE